MDLDVLTRHQRKRILFECVSGSRAYGTANSESDTDIRGVFAQGMEEFVALSPPPALVADERHNSIFKSNVKLYNRYP